MPLLFYEEVVDDVAHKPCRSGSGVGRDDDQHKNEAVLVLIKGEIGFEH